MTGFEGSQTSIFTLPEDEESSRAGKLLRGAILFTGDIGLSGAGVLICGLVDEFVNTGSQHQFKGFSAIQAPLNLPEGDIPNQHPINDQPVSIDHLVQHLDPELLELVGRARPVL